ncbi:PilZ domain-containing protein [Sulfurospirillum sp. 1612]|uniref:PilZ domain-containing protein n=1 Tax=Sulfurospirillum sp. 1612 TaxID=3094835 RepID=UPI002F94AD1C
MDSAFIKSFDTFVDGFRGEFESFLRLQCDLYGYTMPHDNCTILAQDILNNIAKKDIDITDDSIELFINITGHHSMSGFLLSKSLLYILENYTLFLKQHPDHNFEHIGACLHYFSRFSYLFEQKTREKEELKIAAVNFSTNNEIAIKNNIIEIFEQMKQDKKPVTFMNLYQGIPISYEGKILDIGDDTVVFEVSNELQEIAMKLKGKAHFIQNEYLLRHVKADVVYSNFYDHTVTLSNFVYLLNMPAIKREFVRIYPDFFVNVTLIGHESEQINGNLYDLSQNGMGLISSYNPGFYIGAKVIVSFSLTYGSSEHEIRTSGEIVNILDYENAYRYCLKIFPNEEHLVDIMAYIAQRKKDIIETLRTELKEYQF